MTEHIANHLQLLDGKTRKQVFDILFNLGNMYEHFRYLLSVTHSEHLRSKLKDAYTQVEVVSYPTTNLKQTVKLLLEDKKIKVSSDVVYIIYKVVDYPITPSMYTNLQASLGYEVQWLKNAQAERRHLFNCGVCGKTSAREVCTNCTSTLENFTEYRRDSFMVPINYFNFTRIANGEFSFKYKDWVIGRLKDAPVVYFELLTDYVMENPEQYPLPFIEYQRKILS